MPYKIISGTQLTYQKSFEIFSRLFFAILNKIFCMSIFQYKERNKIVLGAIIILAMVIFYSLRNLINAFLGALVLYIIFKPIFLKLKQKIGAIMSAVTLIFASFIIIILPFFALIMMVISKLNSLNKDQFMIKNMIANLDNFAGLKLGQPELIDSYIKKIIEFAQDLFPTILTGTLSIFLIITIMYFILYFMFVQADEFEKVALKYAPLKENHARDFGEELKNTIFSNVLGQGLIAFVQGSLVALTFLIVGVNDPFFWGTIAFFLSFMPVIGAPVITLPAAIILFSNGHNWQGTIVLLITILVIINIDNVIRFVINRRFANTHPIITVLGVIIGLPLFGFVGLAFGPLLLSWFFHLIKVYESDQADQLPQ